MGVLPCTFCRLATKPISSGIQFSASRSNLYIHEENSLISHYITSIQNLQTRLSPTVLIHSLYISLLLLLADLYPRNALKMPWNCFRTGTGLDNAMLSKEGLMSLLSPVAKTSHEGDEEERNGCED